MERSEREKKNIARLAFLLRQVLNKRMGRESNWDTTAREKQKLPDGDWNTWMIMAGRGFGKTRAAAEGVRKLALTGRCKRICLIANTTAEAREVMIEGESGLLNISPTTDGLRYEPSKQLLTWKNGATARIYSAENPEHLRGPQFDCVWIDELAKFKKAATVMNQARLCLRLGKSPKMIISTTPRPTPLIRGLASSEDVVLTTGSTYENADNLSNNFLENIKERFEGSALGAQEIHAMIVDNNKEWWSYEMIARTRIARPPDRFKKVVIGVDPALTCGEFSDETGIIVAASDYNGSFYILDDASGHMSSAEWCLKIIEFYYNYHASEVIVESNAGGDFTKQMIHSFDDSINVKNVYARTSKSARAEPILSLYQQNRVYHAKPLLGLEQQMLDYPDITKSPDRIDALVWAISELMTRNFELQRPESFNSFIV